MLLSNTFTLAPKPIADLAANSPTVPAPIITTSVGVTPDIPPNIPLYRIIGLSLKFRKLTEVTPADPHLPMQALLLQPAAEFGSLPSVPSP